MSLSSVCVVTNALRLNFFKTSKNNGKTSLSNEISQRKEVNTMKKTIYIDGMMCSHCTGMVTKVLNAIDGVSAEVSLKINALILSFQRMFRTICLSKQ